MTAAGDGRPPVRVAIIGAGMSGLCMGTALRRAGIDSFTIYEKAADVGGTWRENTYPGLTCDVPSPFYSYTFAPNPEWSHRYPAGREIHAYLRTVADREGVLAHVRFHSEVVGAEFIDPGWRLRTADGGEHLADVLIAATGVLHHPRVPSFPGAELFRGPAFHSARWDHRVALDGRRVGVIGTGSTGVQIVTALSQGPAEVVHFQRTPQWIFPSGNPAYSAALRIALRRSPWLNRTVYRYHRRVFDLVGQAVIEPGWQRRLMQTVSRGFLRTVRDRDLRRRLTPDYEPLCKRLIVSSGYYRAVQRPNVELVSAGVVRLDEEGVVTDDGAHHPLDVIVYATGFDAHAFLRPIELTGLGGVTLSSAWERGPRAHRTVTLPGFPNLFVLMGPNSPIGNTSLVAIAEAQVAYTLRWIERIRAGEIGSVAPRAEATEAFNREIRDNMGDTVWVTGCDSWYLGPDGTPTLWPFTAQAFRSMLATVDEREYVLTPSAPPAR